MRLAGVARALAEPSSLVRAALVNVVRDLGKQCGFERDLYGVGVRALSEFGEKKLPPLLTSALKTDEFGGLATLSGACFVDDPTLGPGLFRASTCPKTQLAFAAEVARVCRGEAGAGRLNAIAPRIKEAHRISLVVETLLPICLHRERFRAAVLGQLGDSLEVLRGAERHLGRWLVMAEIAQYAGDERPLAEAVKRVTTGPDSSRSAWAFVAWALGSKKTTAALRPTSELLARLSHRPSADRDTAFLFRLAGANVESARPLLEAYVRARPLGEEIALRSAASLIQNYETLPIFADTLIAGKRSAREDVRGLSAALLWDLGERQSATAVAEELLDQSNDLTGQTWAALICSEVATSSPLVTEPRFRRVQWGWVE